MSIWAELKLSGRKPGGGSEGAAALKETIHDPAAGKALIRETINQVADLWTEIEISGGSIAWEWILRGSPHGPEIRAAEDRVNAIGSNGNPAELAAVCGAWVSGWRDGIEAWKFRLPVNDADRTKQASLIF